jgi:hypothetical protein
MRRATAATRPIAVAPADAALVSEVTWCGRRVRAAKAAVEVTKAMRGVRLASVAAISFAAATAAILIPTAASAATASATPGFVASGAKSTFRVHCTGSPQSASLAGTDIGLPSDIAMARTSTGHFSVTLRIPKDTAPGPHDVNMQCSNGDFGTASIQVSPRGGVNTGGGSASGVDMTTAIVGGGAVALAAVGGAILLGRRQNLDPGN